MVFENLRATVNDGLEVNNGLHVPLHKKVRKILRTTGSCKLDFTTNFCQKSIIKIENGNLDHKKAPFFLENTVNFIDLRRPLTSSMAFRKPMNISMVLKRPLEICNGF